VLLCGAGLLLRSYRATMSVDPGFDTERVLTFSLMKMGNATENLAFYDELERRLRSVPGVQAVGGISLLPLAGAGGRAQAHIEGHSWGDRKPPELRWRPVMEGYFNVMDLRLLRGRLFNGSDRSAGDDIRLILNEEAATRLFDSRDPIGARLRLGPDSTSPFYPVVGVVENARNESLTEGVQPEVYGLHAQVPSGGMVMTLRMAVPPLSVVNQVRSHVKELDPTLLVGEVRTTRDLISRSVAQPRFTMLLLLGFALLSLAVAVIGTYGVLAYFVAQRKREIGIRMALGAQRSNILGLIVGEGARLAGYGVGIGIVAALLVSRVLEGMLFQVKPADPVTFVATGLIIALTTILASGLPALAAARLQPESVMRGE
jgi:predicted permease